MKLNNLHRIISLSAELSAAIREAHTDMVHTGSQTAELLIFDLITPGMEFEQRIAGIAAAITAEGKERVPARWWDRP